jgi:hypothetical protein
MQLEGHLRRGSMIGIRRCPAHARSDSHCPIRREKGCLPPLQLFGLCEPERDPDPSLDQARAKNQDASWRS